LTGVKGSMAGNRGNVMAKYLGHRSWAAWNVSLWIGNDEGLYRLALECIRDAKGNGGKAKAAERFLDILADSGVDATPDGARYTLTTVKAAFVGLE
jgi:hypothetical protein